MKNKIPSEGLRLGRDSGSILCDTLKKVAFSDSLGGGYHLHKVTERMKKIFYVCCTRAMEQLAVYYDYPSEEVISKAREWFGEDHMIRLPE